MKNAAEWSIEEMSAWRAARDEALDVVRKTIDQYGTRLGCSIELTVHGLGHHEVGSLTRGDSDWEPRIGTDYVVGNRTVQESDVNPAGVYTGQVTVHLFAHIRDEIS